MILTLIKRIKKFIVKRKLKKILRDKKRRPQIMEFDKVRTVGILYDAGDEDKYKRAAFLFRYLRSKNKKVNALGILATAEVPNYADVNLYNNYITSKDIAWTAFPKVEFVADFINTEFDMLIDLNFYKNETLSIIAQASLAHFKVGLNQDNEIDTYDFMLEGIKPDDMNVFLKELLKYLEIIKTKKA